MTNEQLKEAYRGNLEEGRDFARAHASSLKASATNEKFLKDLDAIRTGLAKSLGKDAEFVQRLGQVFGQIRQRVEEEASLDAELRDLADQVKSRVK